MSINLKYTKDYTELGQIYQLVLPLSLERLVPDDDSVRLLSHELEELDYSHLAEKEITAFIKPQTYEQWKKTQF